MNKDVMISATSAKLTSYISVALRFPEARLIFSIPCIVEEPNLLVLALPMLNGSSEKAVTEIAEHGHATDFKPFTCLLHCVELYSFNPYNHPKPQFLSTNLPA